MESKQIVGGSRTRVTVQLTPEEFRALHRLSAATPARVPGPLRELAGGSVRGILLSAARPTLTRIVDWHRTRTTSDLD